jgi:uncharacterized protein (DUF1800 family)
MTKRDFSALEAKLARGKPLCLAAEEAGIPVEEAKEWLDKRRLPDDQASGDQLALFADEAMAVALAALKDAIAEKNRAVMSTERDGPSVFTSKEAVLDLDAAKALLRAAMDARRMLERRKTPQRKAQAVSEAVQDLFDLGPWKVKKTDP